MKTETLFTRIRSRNRYRKEKEAILLSGKFPSLCDPAASSHLHEISCKVAAANSFLIPTRINLLVRSRPKITDILTLCVKFVSIWSHFGVYLYRNISCFVFSWQNSKKWKGWADICKPYFLQIVPYGAQEPLIGEKMVFGSDGKHLWKSWKCTFKFFNEDDFNTEHLRNSVIWSEIILYDLRDDHWNTFWDIHIYKTNLNLFSGSVIIYVVIPTKE